MTSACASAATKIKATGIPVEPSIYENRLANTQWILKSFGQEGTETPVVEGSTITLNFGTDGRASGSGGCNGYSGNYTAQDDKLTFSRILSTKRACGDNDATRQEAHYFEALQSTDGFNLADDKLTIFYNDDKNSLNFNKAPSSAPSQLSYENLDNPVSLLASYFNAVNLGEYLRAWHYWEKPPGDFEDFARAFANTVKVQLIVQPPVSLNGAAGSLYVQVPAVFIAQHRDGSERVYAGCYVARRSNLRPPDIPKKGVWHIHKAKVKPASGGTEIPELLAQACRN
ncbi:MAG: META domain-containing protein [Blastocatellia bacterium]|nr:META domain-containing protein [Blastocatellia bacterium]